MTARIRKDDQRNILRNPMQRSISISISIHILILIQPPHRPPSSDTDLYIPLHQSTITPPPGPPYPQPFASALYFRFDFNSSAFLLDSSSLASADRYLFSRATDHTPFYSTAVDIGHDQLYPLAPSYPNILHPPIKIFLVPPFPLPLSLDGVHLISPGSLGPLPHPIDIRCEPA